MALTFARCLRLGALGLCLVLVLWFAGNNARGIVAEFGIYYYDDDLVNEGRTLSEAKRRDAAYRLEGVQNQISNYQFSGLGSAPSARKDAAGEPLHGWMALALMYSWQGGVTQFIDYDKPWDDPANRDAFSRRVKDYESPFRSLPRHNAEGYALAHIAGNVRVFEDPSYHTEREYPDGKSNTLLAGDAAGNYQPWGKPRTDRDPALGINKSKDGFGGPWAGGGAMMVFADGSVRMLGKEASPEVLKALASPAGGESLPSDY